ncbi:thiolase family protein [Natronococcus occultus]|uniref:Acetyl-CoA acetyltransferase n=1 Tax=Natronococcus occultus SP4 TaxID=694430 RepID=L0K784_9EURY|nr:acetyl-CoA acetyltransferase [Natronococcus occultus]AGB39983.1 acetyl-CoA acetyltransferase [Natronococcus occultus SP4]
MTTFTGTDDRSLAELLEIAAERALADADLEASTVDSVHVGNMAAEAFNETSGLANALTASLGLSQASARRIENTSATGASAVLDAVDAVRAGRSTVALAVGGEKMSAAETTVATEIISRITHAQEYDQGITLPSFAGLAAAQYLDAHGATRRDLAQVAVKNHANARRNRYAQFDSDVTVTDVLESPKVATPLRLYDCCPTSDGAAAVIVTAANAEVTVEACESAIGVHAVADRRDPLRIESVAAAGRAAYEAADTGPDAIDVACIHDAFTILEWLEMEELGFAERGEAWRLTRNGRTEIEGDGNLAVNPGGGLKARGHPLGATGISQLVELVWQLRGDVPADRAVGSPRYGLAINVAGFGNNSVCTIVEATG